MPLSAEVALMRTRVGVQMVYSNKCVLAVKHNEKFLKEQKNGIVVLPFGASYSLHIRNKHNRRALVKIFIDQEEVSGPGYIIDANSHIQVERFHDVARKFQFAPVDSEEAIESGKNHSGAGVIEAHFYLEKEQKSTLGSYVDNVHDEPEYPFVPHPDDPYVPFRPKPYKRPPFPLGGLDQYKKFGEVPLQLWDSGVRGTIGTRGIDASHAMLMNASYSTSLNQEPEAGCTIEGQYSQQKFHSAYIDVDQCAHAKIKLTLKGVEHDDNDLYATKAPSRPKKASSKLRQEIQDMKAMLDKYQEQVELQQAQEKAENQKQLQTEYEDLKRRMSQIQAQLE